MKKFAIFLLLVTIALSSNAQAIGKAFYIYRNDGGFNAFFRDEVQSIEYSNFDADGNYHDEMVTQIINTADSVYMIPLAAIDSVAFDVNRITISPDYIPMSENGYLVEEADTQNGRYQIRFTSSMPTLRKGDIVSVVNDTIAQLVRIIEIDRLDDLCICIHSQRVTLDEVFISGTFTLSTEVDHSRVRRSSPNEHIFYPVEISFYDEKNKLRRVKRDNSGFTYKLYNKTIDYSGHDLYKSKHTRLYAEKCKLDFALDLVLSCNFSKKETIDRHRRGEMELVRSVIRGNVDTDFMIRFDADASKEVQSGEIMLKPNIHKPIVATFIVAGVPIAIVMNTHLLGEYSYDVSGDFSVYTGHTTSTTAEIGLSWSKTGSLRPYGNISGSFNFHKPKIEGRAHLESKVCMFPRITFSLYGVIGPTFDLKPYLHPILDIDFKDQLGTNKDDYYGAEFDLFAGYDAAVGISEFPVLGKESFVMSPSWNVINKMLLEAPKKIEFVKSVPDALKLGQTMKVTFHAMDYDYVLDRYIDEILPFPVKFETNSGTLSSDFALVNPETGLVSIEWTPDTWKKDGKDAYILALMYAPGGHVKTADRWTPTIIEVNPKSYVEVITDSITSTSALLEYGFNSIPKDAVCNIAVQAKADEKPVIYPVNSIEKDSILIADLQPSTTYSYWAYVEYMGKTYMNPTEKKSFTTLTPRAITGDCMIVTISSATVSCTYENIPKSGICGVEYTWNDGSVKKNIGNVKDTQEIVLSGLKPGTTYTYCAYIEANGQTYYGEEKTFTTIAEPTDIAGVWHCKEYQEGSLTGEGTFKLNTDGTVTRSDLRNSGSELGSQTGRWAINANGLVHIYFEYITNSGASEKSYSGTINSFVNPTQIEGNATYRYTGNMGGGTVRTYDFVMTR